MRRVNHAVAPAALLLASVALAMSARVAHSAAASIDTLDPDNAFAQPSSLPYQLPPFDHIRDSDFRPAFIAGMAEQRREVDAIAKAAQPPTFDNTIVALERSGRLLDRVTKVFFNLTTSNSDEEILKIETEMRPKLAAHEDAIHLDAALFARIDSLYQQRAHFELIEHRLRGGVLQRDQPFTIEAARFGRIRRGRDLLLRQAFQLCALIDHHRIVTGGLEQVLSKLRGQRGELLIEGAQLLLL